MEVGLKNKRAAPILRRISLQYLLIFLILIATECSFKFFASQKQWLTNLWLGFSVLVLVLLVWTCTLPLNYISRQIFSRDLQLAFTNFFGLFTFKFFLFSSRKIFQKTWNWVLSFLCVMFVLLFDQRCDSSTIFSGWKHSKRQTTGLFALWANNANGIYSSVSKIHPHTRQGTDQLSLEQVSKRKLQTPSNVGGIKKGFIGYM